jgi:hypothetical protein
MTIQNPAFVNRTLYAQHRYLITILNKNKAYITNAILTDELCKDGFAELHEYLETLEDNINEITEEFVVANPSEKT